MKPDEIVNATEAELDDLLAQAKPTFTPEQYLLLERVLGTFVHVMKALQNAKTSLKRFRNMLFGARTESMANVLKRHDADAAGEPINAEPAGDSANAGAVTTAADAADDGTPPQTPHQSKPGHGRIAAAAYRDAPVVTLEPSDVSSGDPCPQCVDGKVYDCPPRVIVKVTGQPPLGATVYQQRRLRCRLCDAVFAADLPHGVAEAPKYDASCASMLALLRYGSGMPFYRLEGLQNNLDVPLPDATQWDIVARAVSAPSHVYQELIGQAAQAALLYNDDTPARILSLTKERTTAEAAGLEPKGRAINTSGIVAVLRTPQREVQVALFFTGHAHAGDNLARVLEQRASELALPMHMCDGLAANIPSAFATILCNCIAHGRRKFVELVDHFPSECRTVLETLAQVYANDEHCRVQNLSPEQRLTYHQATSAAPMHALQTWMRAQLDQRAVEPNSSLGRAMTYMLKRWSALTLFLRSPGAPLDNNVCERALKRAIRHRKNSLFFKTAKGAEVGDIYMSLIHTCELCGVNAFAYLQALHTHVEDVVAHPAQWLPWNYREELMPRLARAA